jgi:anti-sigma factor RsiW
MMPDLHPEELFDKAARGELNEGERALLDAHLAQCAACRFAQQATADFAAVAMPQLNIDSLVTNALLARATADLAPAPTEARRRPPRRFGLLAAAVVATFAMGSFAAVGQWTGVLPRLVAAVMAPRTDVDPSPERSPRVNPRTTAAPAPRVLELPVVEQPVTPPPVVEAPPSPPSRVAPAHRPVVAAAPAQVETPAPSVDVTPDIPQPPPETASSVFAAANRARLDGDRVQAMGRYQRLLTTWPDAVEASQTRATLGRLLLDQGDPANALTQLDAYLASGDGTLREEVLSARAQAFMRLGRDADEQAAWRMLLAEFPSSIHAARAHARLGEPATP